MPTTAVRRLISLFRRSSGFVLRILGRWVSGKVIGLSKLTRVLEVVAKRPQIQERMTSIIADTIMEKLKPRGVMVIIDAEHLCMSMRGVKKQNTLTVTSAVRGLFRNNPASRAEVLSLIYNGK